jgi:hypothetical protein
MTDRFGHFAFGSQDSMVTTHFTLSKALWIAPLAQPPAFLAPGKPALRDPLAVLPEHDVAALKVEPG